MGCIERLRKDYGIRTQISSQDGRVYFTGAFRQTDTYRRAEGKDSAWIHITLLMADAEREARNITVI